MQQTIFNCSNCNKKLLPGEREYCERDYSTECTECLFHALNGTRNIKEYNKWLHNVR